MLRLGLAVVVAAGGAVWAVSDELNNVDKDLRQEIRRLEVDLRQEINASREALARFEGATTATLQQQSATLAQLLQLAHEKK